MADFAYCDKSLPYEVRAKDLVDRMTLVEKAEQMGDNTSRGIPRIGLPMYKWWSEALHGVSDIGRSTKFDPLVPSATSFPMVIHTAATFNKSLWKTIGQFNFDVGVPCKIVSPIDAFSEYGTVDYEMGCGEVKCKNDSLIFEATKAAEKADATLIFVGLSLEIEAEWWDRKDLLLPGYQTQLVKAVSEAAKGPVILIVMTAGVLDISFAKNNPKISAILWTGYPGEQGGRAIADVVFGKYNPGGRLPLTWYQNDYVKDFPMTSMSLRPVENYPGRTYKFFNGSTVYPFGYGLSYTSFKYQHKSSAAEISVETKLNRFQHCRGLLYRDGKVRNGTEDCASVLVDDLTCKDEISFEIRVENVGEKDGSDVVMVYSVPPKEIEGTHIKQLVGFERVYVGAKQSKNVKFVLNACKALSIVDATGYTLLPSVLGRLKGLVAKTIMVFSTIWKSFLAMENVYDYMFHLLKEYAKLLKFKPTIPPNAKRVCAETMACACPEEGLFKKFMEQSMVKSPSHKLPCNLPPQYEPP
ncbi:hypothetical protein COLO4_12684 [Corchorus olitorius]|uniref:Fibronectin type III-like domain-containing protein n=1 Tax=Corchorus olitorius TaxID=93759 RepID=A0A1R3K012_9ROSI|nr:hypothetical protein COLO4_12684 [Corchorus olitorius]